MRTFRIASSSFVEIIQSPYRRARPLRPGRCGRAVLTVKDATLVPLSFLSGRTVRNRFTCGTMLLVLVQPLVAKTWQRSCFRAALGGVFLFNLTHILHGRTQGPSAPRYICRFVRRHLG